MQTEHARETATAWPPLPGHNVTGMRFAGRRQARSAERGARSSRALFWSRFKRDRLALTSAIFLVFVIVGCFAGLPVAEHFLGHGPNDIFPLAADINGYPAGPWSHVPNSHGVPVVTPETPRTLFILGADGQLGHDEFLRLLAGGQTSLEIGVGAALLAILIGVTVGLLAGYYGRVIDTVFSRTTEFVMGFPILLFVIALFSWFYPARLVRAQVLALREQEFVEAARMVGASNFRILRKHLLPHVASSVIVYGTLVIAGSILLEAALAILNFGIDLPDASWGNMISLNYGTLLVPGGVAGATGSTGIRASWLVPLWPSIALLLTVLAFALLGEGVRAALDPREQRR